MTSRMIRWYGASAAAVAWTTAALLPAVPPTASPAAQPAPIVLPVERASNVFFARVEIAGRGPFWFTVDTGATLTVIDPTAAARAGLTVRAAGRRPNVGVGEDDTDLATTAATIRIAGLPDFAPPFVYVMPVQSAAAVLGHAIDGVLGTDVLRSYVGSSTIPARACCCPRRRADRPATRPQACASRSAATCCWQRRRCRCRIARMWTRGC